MNKQSCRVLSALVAINVATLGGTVQAMAEESTPAPEPEQQAGQSLGDEKTEAEAQPVTRIQNANSVTLEVNPQTLQQEPSPDPKPQADAPQQGESEIAGKPGTAPADESQPDSNGSSPAAGDAGASSDKNAGGEQNANAKEVSDPATETPAVNEEDAPNQGDDEKAEPVDGQHGAKPATRQSAPVPAGEQEASNQNSQQSIVYVDLNKSTLGTAGQSYEDAFNDLASAVAHMNTQNASNYTIHIRGRVAVSSDKPQESYWAIIPSGVTLYIDEDTDITCNKDKKINGIKLNSGATLTGKGKLTMTGFYTALYCETGSYIRDGHYVFKDNGVYVPVAQNGKPPTRYHGGLVLSDHVEGSKSSKDCLIIDSNDVCDVDFIWRNNDDHSLTNYFTNCTINAYSQNPAYQNQCRIILNNASLSFNGFGDESWGGSGFYTDLLSMSNGSDLHIGSSPATDNSFGANPVTALGTQGQGFDISDSTIEIDAGKKCGWSYGCSGDKISTLRNSTIIFNNGGGVGFNVNSGTVRLSNSTIVSNKNYTDYNTDNHNTNKAGAIFFAQRDKGTIQFLDNCRVEAQDPKDDSSNGKRFDNNFIVLGGSYNITYVPDADYSINGHGFNGTTPNNGPDNGSEPLSLFTLSDASVSTLNPINNKDKGTAYTYEVSAPSSDGQKHVWVPAAKVIFELNAPNATANAAFADRTTSDKFAYAMRGYALKAATDINQGYGGLTTKKPADPTATGYLFVGWFYKDGNGAEQEFTDATKVKGDMTVYAKWARETEPLSDKVHSDLLLNDDTQSVEAIGLRGGATFNLTGGVSISSMKTQLDKIAGNYPGVPHAQIRLYHPDLRFDITLALPDEISLPSNLDASMVRINGDGFKVSEVEQAGAHRVRMRFALAHPEAIRTYADLENVLRSASGDGWIKLTIPGTKVSEGAAVENDLVVRATVRGNLTVAAGTGTGELTAYNLAWSGVQWPDGRDPYATNDDEIRLTARVSPEARAEAPKVHAARLTVRRHAPQAQEAPAAAKPGPAHMAAEKAPHALPQTGDGSVSGGSLLAVIGSAILAMAAGLRSRRHGREE